MNSRHIPPLRYMPVPRRHGRDVSGHALVLDPLRDEDGEPVAVGLLDLHTVGERERPAQAPDAAVLIEDDPVASAG